jgi:hypothetical protein
MPAARVVAFEIDPRGRALITSLAEANGVAARVQVRGGCDRPGLATAAAAAVAGGPALIVCDCEGAEYDLISLPGVPALQWCDVLLELHRVRGYEPKAHWDEQLRATHDLTFVDPAGRDTGAFPELTGLAPEDRARVLFERTDTDGWLLAVARSQPAERRGC